MGVGVWAEKAQNRLGDFGGESLDAAGGGGDFGRLGGTAVSEPNEEPESRLLGGW
jgi:hypothetical protein